MEKIQAYASHIISPYHRVGILSFLRHFALPERHIAATIYIESGNWRKTLLLEELFRENHFSANFTINRPVFCASRSSQSFLCTAIYA